MIFVVVDNEKVKTWWIMDDMSVQERRDKLMEQFQMMIQDEQKMDQLEVFFSEILNQEESALSAAQWLEVEKISEDYKSGKISGSSWEDVKSRIRSKHGV